MNVLYSSKGLSKTAKTKKIISIALCLFAMIVLILFAQSKVNGPTQNVVIGGIDGSFTQFQSTRYRFSSEERQTITLVGYLLGLLGVVDAAVLGLSKRSWTEIHTDGIQGSFMGKTISYSISEIKSVSTFGEYLIINGNTSKTGLITQNPKQARQIIDQLLLNR